jgi:serine protease Do
MKNLFRKNLIKNTDKNIIKDDFRIDKSEKNIEDAPLDSKDGYNPESATQGPSTKVPFGLLALFSLGILLLSITSVVGYFLFWSNRQDQNIRTVTETQLKVVSEESAIIESVEKNGPAVVNIYAYYDINPNPRLRRNAGDGTLPKNLIGLGSGVIIESDGLILTNKHILKSQNNRVDYEVVLKDDRRFKVEKFYFDPELDLAIIKINAQNLPTVTLGDSDSLKLGQSVIAIGNPMGLSNSVTKGVVSALNRDIDVSTSLFESSIYSGMIQTDAAINPGNSGGGLFNLSGQLVGINSAAGVSSDNIGFAIPINKAKMTIEAFKNNGSTMQELGQAFLGITYSFEDFSYYIRNGFPIGPVVKSVLTDSAAENAGLKVGDIIVSIDEEEFYSEQDLSNYISNKKIGDKIRIKIYREEKVSYLDAVLQKREEENR